VRVERSKQAKKKEAFLPILPPVLPVIEIGIFDRTRFLYYWKAGEFAMAVDNCWLCDDVAVTF
jgi:hypothetical protein